MADIDIYDPLVPDQQNLNDIKYAARDFTSMADDLLRRLKIEYGTVYNDYASTNTGIMLRDLIAWAYSALIWYLDRTASDCFLDTARTRHAVQRLVEQIAYKMRGASASGTTLTLTFPDGTESGFIMKSRWKFAGPNGMTFESYSKKVQTTAIAENGTITIDVRQGDTRTITYTSDGSKNQVFRLTGLGEDQWVGVGTITTWVDGQEWEERDFLEFTNDEHYEVSYLLDVPIIRFGDGIAGKIPPADAEVKIRYLIVDGAKGNVKANAITSSTDVLTINGAPVTFEVTNLERATGGEDPETIDSAKKYAPVSFAARGAAITKTDYDALSSTFRDSTYGAVAKAYAINPRSPVEDTVFNGLSTAISELLTDYVSDIETTDANIDATVVLAGQTIASILVSTGLTTTGVETINSYAQSIATSVISCKETLLTARGKSDSAHSLASSVLQLTTNLRDSVSVGALTNSEIVTELNTIISYLQSINTDTGDASNYILSSTTIVDDGISPRTNQIVTLSGEDGDIYTQSNAIETYVGDLTTNMNSIVGYLGDVYGDANTLQTAIESNLSDMTDHITVILTDDCMNNYVQVPILSTDLNGDYTAPSLGLIRALQTYLDGIKEVTQVVEVVDGTPILIPADISMILTVIDGYVFSNVESIVRSTIVRILKRREFNSPLYLSKVYKAVEDIPGVDHVNITISSTSGYIDNKGNLIPDENRVVILGNLTIVEG